MELVSIGFGSFISSAKLVAAVPPDSSPIRRVVSQAREGGRLIDATYGRKTESVLIMDSGHIILCPLSGEKMAEQTAQQKGEKDG